MMNKKIVILVNTLQSGGAEKQSTYLHNALYEDYVVYLLVWHADRIDNKIKSLLKIEDGRLIRLEGNLISKIQFLYKFFRKHSITHLFTYLTKPNFLGGLVAKLAGVKYIYSGIRNSSLPLWKIILEIISSTFFSTGVIFNNYSGKKHFSKFRFTNTFVIPNCFYDTKNPIERKEDNIIKIITVGRFVPQKDYSTALKTIKELSRTKHNFIFQIVGYGILEKQIRKKVDDLSLNAYVDMFINPHNIEELLQQADIYLSTSLFEGTSNSIMEAMNASLPIVATNVGDNDNLIFPEKNGFLHEVGEVKGLSNSIEILMNNHSLRIQYGVESNRILHKKYSFMQFKTSYIQLIEQK